MPISNSRNLHCKPEHAPLPGPTMPTSNGRTLHCEPEHAPLPMPTSIGRNFHCEPEHAPTPSPTIPTFNLETYIVSLNMHHHLVQLCQFRRGRNLHC